MFFTFVGTPAELQTVCQTFWQRIYLLEGDKYDLERQSRLKAMEVTEQKKTKLWPKNKCTTHTTLPQNPFHINLSHKSPPTTIHSFKNQLIKLKKNYFNSIYHIQPTYLLLIKIVFTISFSLSCSFYYYSI